MIQRKYPIPVRILCFGRRNPDTPYYDGRTAMHLTACYNVIRDFRAFGANPACANGWGTRSTDDMLDLLSEVG
jgi:hypothetical protein